MDIRLLKANEIEVRVQSVKKTKNGVGAIMLLYKDARCDMKILDETFGVLGWEREHHLINGNLFCTVRVWDSNKNMWISKQDVGTESNTEKEKGQASDSFKRACFNLGIGRELYTSPFIWVNLNDNEYTEYNGKLASSIKLNVKNIKYNEDKEISLLEIEDNKGNIRFTMGKVAPVKKEKKISDLEVEKIFEVAARNNISKENVIKGVKKYYNTENIKELTKVQYEELYTKLEGSK